MPTSAAASRWRLPDAELEYSGARRNILQEFCRKLSCSQSHTAGILILAALLAISFSANITSNFLGACFGTSSALQSTSSEDFQQCRVPGYGLWAGQILKVEEERECRKELRETADLQAQRGMAQCAVSQFWLSALGTLLIFLTVGAAFWTAFEASKAAAAADQTVRATWEIGRAQARCELRFAEGGLSGWLPLSFSEAKGRFRFRNDGNSAARNVTITIGTKIASSSGNAGFLVDTSSNQVFNAVGPGAPMDFWLSVNATSALGAQAKSLIAQPAVAQQVLMVWHDVIITYDDVFDMRWVLHMELEAPIELSGDPNNPELWVQPLVLTANSSGVKRVS